VRVGQNAHDLEIINWQHVCLKSETEDVLAFQGKW